MTVPAFNVINNTNKIALVINGKFGYINQEQADIAQAQLNDDDFFGTYVGHYAIIAPNQGKGEPITNYKPIDIMGYLAKLAERTNKRLELKWAKDDELSLQDRLVNYKHRKELAKFDKDSDEYFDFILNSL